jgi:hypothetical protein
MVFIWFCLRSIGDCLVRYLALISPILVETEVTALKISCVMI